MRGNIITKLISSFLSDTAKVQMRIHIITKGDRDMN